jgi:hypothetical protein
MRSPQVRAVMALVALDLRRERRECKVLMPTHTKTSRTH